MELAFEDRDEIKRRIIAILYNEHIPRLDADAQIQINDLCELVKEYYAQAGRDIMTGARVFPVDELTL